MKIVRMAFIVSAFCCFAFCCQSMAAEIYVAPAGNDDSGNGDISNPYRSIQHVLDNIAVTGDLIILRSGIYNENIRIRKPSITIRSKNDEWAIIQSEINDEEKAIAVIFDVDSDGSRLQRIEVIGGHWYGIKFQTNWGDPNDGTGASNIIVEDCKIHDTGNACIKITPGCDDITVRRCEIFNSGRVDPDSAEAIDNVNGDRMLVLQCHIHDITGTGLYAKGGAIGTLIDSCLIEDCGGAGILIGFDTSPEFFDTVVNPNYYENIDGMVKNCIVINTRYAGIGMYAAKSPQLFNNTIVNAAEDGHAGLYFGITFQDWELQAGRPPSVDPIIRNNIVVQRGSVNPTVVKIQYANELGGLSGLSGMPMMSNNRYHAGSGTAIFEDNRPGYTFSGGLISWQSHISGDADTKEADPGFVAPAMEDYRLSSSSTCIDTGTANGAPAIDHEGAARPQGKGYDIGAYEYIDSDQTMALYVDSQGGCGGKTPCFTAINAAINAAGDSAAIMVAAGTYQEAVIIDKDTRLLIGWNADFTSLDQRNPVVLATTTPGVQAGHVTYTFGEQVYRIKAVEGAIPENITQKLNNLSSLPQGGSDENLNISPDGKWLVLITERFHDDCAGWACLAVVADDVSSGEVLWSNGTVIHPASGSPAISSGGNLIVYSSTDGEHDLNLWAVSRGSGTAWGAPFELTKDSTYAYNEGPAINGDGTKIVFTCTNDPYSGDTNICEVGTDGEDFHVLLTPSDSPEGLPDKANFHAPDYAQDGSIVFEADWDGEYIWRLTAGATEPVKITSDFNNDNSPCVLPDGSIASLWLNRPGGLGHHELKVMAQDGSSYFMLLNEDVADIGIGCGD